MADPTDDQPHPVHPLILPLLEGIEHIAEGHSRIPLKVLKVAEQNLRTQQVDAPFLDLLAVWHRLHLAGVQPAAQQLLKILKIFPQVREVQTAHEMAHKAKQLLKDRVSSPSTQSGIAKPRTLGVSLRSTPRK